MSEYEAEDRLTAIYEALKANGWERRRGVWWSKKATVRVDTTHCMYQCPEGFSPSVAEVCNEVDCHVTTAGLARAKTHADALISAIRASLGMDNKSEKPGCRIYAYLDRDGWAFCDGGWRKGSAFIMTADTSKARNFRDGDSLWEARIEVDRGGRTVRVVQSRGPTESNAVFRAIRSAVGLAELECHEVSFRAILCAMEGGCR